MSLDNSRWPPVLHNLKSGEKLGVETVQHGGHEWRGRIQSWRGKT